MKAGSRWAYVMAKASLLPRCLLWRRSLLTPSRTNLVPWLWSLCPRLLLPIHLCLCLLTPRDLCHLILLDLCLLLTLRLSLGISRSQFQMMPWNLTLDEPQQVVEVLEATSSAEVDLAPPPLPSRDGSKTLHGNTICPSSNFLIVFWEGSSQKIAPFARKKHGLVMGQDGGDSDTAVHPFPHVFQMRLAFLCCQVGRLWSICWKMGVSSLLVLCLVSGQTAFASHAGRPGFTHNDPRWLSQMDCHEPPGILKAGLEMLV